MCSAAKQTNAEYLCAIYQKSKKQNYGNQTNQVCVCVIRAVYCFAFLFLPSYSLPYSSVSFPFSISIISSFPPFFSSQIIAFVLSIQSGNIFLLPLPSPFKLSLTPILTHRGTTTILPFNCKFYPYFLSTAFYKIKTQYVQQTSQMRGRVPIK